MNISTSKLTKWVTFSSQPSRTVHVPCSLRSRMRMAPSADVVTSRLAAQFHRTKRRSRYTGRNRQRSAVLTVGRTVYLSILAAVFHDHAPRDTAEIMTDDKQEEEKNARPTPSTSKRQKAYEYNIPFFCVCWVPCVFIILYSRAEAERPESSGVRPHASGRHHRITRQHASGRSTVVRD